MVYYFFRATVLLHLCTGRQIITSHNQDIQLYIFFNFCSSLHIVTDTPILSSYYYDLISHLFRAVLSSSSCSQWCLPILSIFLLFLLSRSTLLAFPSFPTTYVLSDEYISLENLFWPTILRFLTSGRPYKLISWTLPTIKMKKGVWGWVESQIQINVYPRSKTLAAGHSLKHLAAINKTIVYVRHDVIVPFHLRQLRLCHKRNCRP